MRVDIDAYQKSIKCLHHLRRCIATVYLLILFPVGKDWFRSVISVQVLKDGTGPDLNGFRYADDA